jgi:hypothetical protein
MSVIRLGNVLLDMLRAFAAQKRGIQVKNVAPKELGI